MARFELRGLPLVLALILVGGGSAQAQARLEEAKVLYASAAYTEALDALNGAPNGASPLEIARYRALCLLALGRTADAQREVQTVVEGDPLFVPAGEEVTPRMVTMFVDVRRRILPQIIRREFVDAARLFLEDQPKARDAFEHVLQMLADPLVSQHKDIAEHNDLLDLKLVSTGFVERIRSLQSARSHTSVAPPIPADLPAPPSLPTPPAP